MIEIVAAELGEVFNRGLYQNVIVSDSLDIKIGEEYVFNLYNTSGWCIGVWARDDYPIPSNSILRRKIITKF